MNDKFLRLLAMFTAWTAPFITYGGEFSNAEVIAQYVSVPLTLDGRLDEKAWATAPAYALLLPLKVYANQPESIQKNVGDKLREQAVVKLLWDDNYLYVGGEFKDSDVVNEGTENQTHLYSTGDLLEVFLKPSSSNYYWEIYGAPNNKKTWFFFPSRGRFFLPSSAAYLPAEFKVAAAVNGTLNDYRDRDHGWSVEMAIPIKELTALGARFDNTAAWTILLARYNYSVYLEKTELSAYPLLSNANWHIYEEYAKLRLRK